MENGRVFLVFFTIFFSGAHSITFIITNNCPFTVWPGALTASGRAPLSTTGLELGPKASVNVNAPAGWSGRFWGRTNCGNQGGRFTCGTGDCGSGQVACNGAGGAPPVSLVELTLNGDGNKDFYDISLVDGFNIPVSLAPRGGCATTACASNINAGCPAELQVRGVGGVIGCKSACLAFGKPEFCCSGAYGTPDKCPPSSYSKLFKSKCPQAYSYAYDDKSSTFTCPSSPNYVITFCPDGFV